MALIGDVETDSPRRGQPMYLKCTKCSHEFQIAKRDFNLQHKDATDSVPGMGHCPGCKGRFCSTLMSVCPHCKQRVATAADGTGENAGKKVCSKCGGVVGQWQRPRQ